MGTAGIGKSQAAMTLAVVCALDYPDNGVIFFDVEHNFSAKRLSVFHANGTCESF